MDANEVRNIEQEITNLLVEIFRVEGENFSEKIKYLEVASKIHEESKKSLINDLNEFRIIRNNVIHPENKIIPDDVSIQKLWMRIHERILRFAVPEFGNVPFFIINKNSGKCLDVPWVYKNGKVHQWEKHGGKNQQWVIRKTASDAFVIFSNLSGKCLNIENQSLEQPAWLQVWDYSGNTNQQFSFSQLEDGSYSISVLHSQLFLDLWESNPENGALITQWSWHGGVNQRWYIVPGF